MSLSRQLGPESQVFDFTHERRTYEVFRGGSGPAVLVLHEIPGLHNARHGVRLLRWPAQEPQRHWCRDRHIPRVLLVEPGHVPPTVTDVFEDWVRQPISESGATSYLPPGRRASRSPS